MYEKDYTLVMEGHRNSVEIHLTTSVVSYNNPTESVHLVGIVTTDLIL